MICERCRGETFFGYGRTLLGKKIIVCYKCAKEIDEEENQNGVVIEHNDKKGEGEENTKQVLEQVEAYDNGYAVGFRRRQNRSGKRDHV